MTCDKCGEQWFPGTTHICPGVGYHSPSPLIEVKKPLNQVFGDDETAIVTDYSKCYICGCGELKELKIQQPYTNVSIIVCPMCGVMRLAPDQPNVLQTLETFKNKETSSE